ncbi:hypothetical protein JD969_17845 [Planctomycetota bacterium]|nr:hypothetical protein JD969_17845 [Planctomycetota bacterium]
MDIEIPADVSLRPMTKKDVKAVGKILAAQNKEEAEEAVAYYKKNLIGQYVMTKGRKIAGVAGFEAIRDTDRSFWLTWSGIDGQYGGNGINSGILLELVKRELQQEGARKVFVNLSTQDPVLGGSGRRFGGAEQPYLDFGFKIEIRQKGYYTANEDVMVLGMQMTEEHHEVNKAFIDAEVHVNNDEKGLRILDYDEIEETDDAYFVDWEYVGGIGDNESKVREVLSEISGFGGRVAFVGVPSDAAGVIEIFKAAGFVEEGRVSDLIANGLDEVRLRYNIGSKHVYI